jgi:aminobenzoyl-glutamate utilization protein B
MKILLVGLLLCTASAAAKDPKVTAMKADAAGQVEAMQKQTQVMVDTVFSFAELGFQEFETSKYLTGVWRRKESESSEA